MKPRCKNCLYFERKNWLNSEGVVEGVQMGGNCPLLLSVLKLDNSKLLFINDLYVQDAFGCSLFKEKEQ